MSHSTEAARQYATRPKDERFESIAALRDAAAAVKARCVTKTADLRACRFTDAARITGPEGSQVEMSHWAFSQLASLLGAPASYLRRLPADLLAQCLDHGRKSLDPHSIATQATFLIHAPADADVPTVRAITSPRYARIWDANVADYLVRHLPSEYDLPKTWAGPKAGAYRGDRSSFIFVVNGGSLVDDPTAEISGAPGAGRGLYKGLIIRNSEVGASSLGVSTFLFRVVCGNHLIWGMTSRQAWTRRHVGTNATQQFRRALDGAMEWARTPAEEERDWILRLNATEIAATKDDVIKAGRAQGLSQSVAEAAYAAAELSESNPRSAWGYVQGLTRVSQEQTHVDGRQDLDEIGGAMLRLWQRRLANRVTA